MRKLRLALCVLVFIGALGLTLYPLVSNYCAERYQSTAIAAYAANVSSMDDTTLDSARQAAAEYNNTIRAVTLDGPDAISRLNQAANGYSDYLNVNGDGIMGYIRIPSIGITLPIYHGVEPETLEHGAGHLPGSSLPSSPPIRALPARECLQTWSSCRRATNSIYLCWTRRWPMRWTKALW